MAAEPPREPAARADVGLAGLADGRADEDALGLRGAPAREEQRSRHAPGELAEPRGATRTGRGGARFARRRRRRSRRPLALLGQRSRSTESPRRTRIVGAVEARRRARSASAARIASWRAGIAVSEVTASDGRARRERRGELARGQGRDAFALVARRAAAASAGPGCARRSSTTQGDRGGSACAGDERVEDHAFLAERRRRHDLAHPGGVSGTRIAQPAAAREKLSRGSRRRPEAARRRHRLGAAASDDLLRAGRGRARGRPRRAATLGGDRQRSAFRAPGRPRARGRRARCRRRETGAT